MVVDNMIDGETSEKGKRIQEQNVMRDLTIWLTYHDDSQIEQYGLREDDVFRLFKGNAVNVEGDNINHLNAFYSEIVTFYYVWKNNVRSEKVGFCHYRRRFQQLMDIEKGQCQVLAINGNCSVFGHYKISHNYQDFYDAVEILNEQYEQNNPYSKYLLESRTFIPFCCFVMHWEDFDRLCRFLFPVLFAWDKKNGLNMDPRKYAEKAVRDFRYDNVMYQQRAIAFLAERLISCFLVCEMKVFCVNEL